MTADIDELLARADTWMPRIALMKPPEVTRELIDDLALELRDQRLELAGVNDKANWWAHRCLQIEAENETARAVIRRLLDGYDYDPDTQAWVRVIRSYTGDPPEREGMPASDAERALLASIEDAPREPAGDGQPREDR